MPFVDEIKIYAEAGRGGDGVVRWRREKFIPKGGPAGGDGGRGGDFYVLAVRDINALARYKAKRDFRAGRGKDGGGRGLHGAKGRDFVLEVPVGSVITNLSTDDRLELLKEGERVLLLSGGRGGFGNEHFKSSTNTTPREWEPGGEGEKGDFRIELELFANLGLVGLPSAGKSSLLNALTGARARVGDYPFTTLEPNLGDFHGYVIADIPGLIEGAHEGKGLGAKFLRHIKRTKTLAHLVSFENLSRGSSGMLRAYEEVRRELLAYDCVPASQAGGLSGKREIIILTKSDMAEDPAIVERERSRFAAIGERVFTISLFDDASVKVLRDGLGEILREI